MSPAASAERAAPPSAPRPHLVLLGLPGAGKSTVGPLVATRLGWPCVDLDAAIVARTGMPIATLFAREGEGVFRDWERRLTAELAPVGGPPIVLAPGAGWIEDPGHRARLGVSMLGVYLRVSPGVAVARMGGESAARPLVAGPDPVAAVAALQARREAFYLQAKHEVSTDLLVPDEVASFIVALASRETGD
ncbi:MAG: hypothetical protein RL139_262 [Gemmatimonadota bacterium]|jgi:shikimate kinase